MSLWEECEGVKHKTFFNLTPWRVVEAQHVSSSRDLVDTLAEHELLEEILEESKPSVNKNIHYLLFSPFRYPPLKYGSRFGRVHEPSIWYGSLDLDTAFAEVAYYRLKFLNDSQGEFGYIEISLTAFSSNLKTKKGIDLCAPPFLEHQEKISNKNTYEYSQPLGTAMRQAGIEAFTYTSARTKHNGKNIAAFTPQIFVKKNNKEINVQQNWRCITNKNIIEFSRLEILSKKKTITFIRQLEKGLSG